MHQCILTYEHHKTRFVQYLVLMSIDLRKKRLVLYVAMRNVVGEILVSMHLDDLQIFFKNMHGFMKTISFNLNSSINSEFIGNRNTKYD